MTYYEQVVSGIEQLQDAFADAPLQDGNDLTAVVGLSSPSRKTVELISKAASYPLGAAFGTLNYVLGNRPYKGNAGDFKVTKIEEMSARGRGRQKGRARGNRGRRGANRRGFAGTGGGRGRSYSNNPSVRRMRLQQMADPRTIGTRNVRELGPAMQRRYQNDPAFRREINRGDLGALWVEEDVPIGSVPSYMQPGPKLSAPRGMRLNPRVSVKDGSQIKAVMQSGEDFRIRKASSTDTIISAKLSLGKIAIDTNNKSLWVANGASDVGGQFYFNPANPYYIRNTNVIQRTATAFEDYQVLDGEVYLTPLCSGYSNPDFRIAVLVTRSVDYFARCGSTQFVTNPVTPVGTDTPKRDTLLNNPAACTSACWNEKLVCPIPRSGWKKTACPDFTTSTGQAFSFTDSMASQRQSYAFVIGINIEANATPASITYTNEIWMNIRIRFKNQAFNQQQLVTYDAKLGATPDEIEVLRGVLEDMRVRKKAKSTSLKLETTRPKSRSVKSESSLDAFPLSKERKARTDAQHRAKVIADYEQVLRSEEKSSTDSLYTSLYPGNSLLPIRKPDDLIDSVRSVPSDEDEGAK